jgi:ribulose-phosphate 3-epimerase
VADPSVPFGRTRKPHALPAIAVRRDGRDGRTLRKNRPVCYDPATVTSKIYVSILNADFRYLADQIAAAEAGGADGVHVDVMDGHFVPNLSLGPQVVAAVKASTKLFIDVHLMIERPERLLESFIQEGADSVTIHQEATPHARLAVDLIHGHGARAGLGLNPGTPVAHAAECVDQIEMLLIMTVNPGFGGQALIPETVDKVARARAWLAKRNSNADLQVDGGVNVDNARALCQAGAEIFVAGTSVFHAPQGPAAGVRALRAALPEEQQSRVP